MPTRTLVVFHYHLLHGGVRSSIMRGLLALGRSGRLDGWRIRLLVGSKAGVNEFENDLTAAKIPFVGIDAVVDGRLHYHDEDWPDEGSFHRESTELAHWLLAQGEGEALFWIHNAALGKNPLVTSAWYEAVKSAERANAPFRFLYHIHDFVECGRLENLMRLRSCWRTGGITDYYPQGPSVGYAVLSRADRLRLVSAGIPEERVYYLPNVVNPPSVEIHEAAGRSSKITDALSRYAVKEGYLFEKEKPWWVLPIRLIRRKNVLEALLLAAIAAEPPQLLLTLDANSAQERPYAEAVKSMVKGQRLPMVIGFGHELVGTSFSLSELLHSARTVVTTSLLEGFGFAFLDPAMHGVAVTGRDLPEVTRDYHAAGFPQNALYSRFRVPVPAEERERLIQMSRRLIDHLAQRSGICADSLQAFGEELVGCYRQAAVDFGMLDLPAQSILVRQVRQPGFLQEITDLNPEACQSPIAFAGDFRANIMGHFGPAAFAEKFHHCMDTLFATSSGSAPRNANINISGSILQQFLTPAHQRPLLGGWP
jgi:hypothetical protein